MLWGVLQDDYIPGLFYGGGPKYDALLPSPEMLTEAWQTGTAALEGESATWAELAMRDATRLVRSNLAIVGGQVGVPAVFVSAFDTILAAKPDPTAQEIFDMVSGVAATTIDAAFQTMGAVPVIGFIGELIGIAVKFALSRREKGDPPPPFVRYNPEINATMTALLMDQVGTMKPPSADWRPDWTPIFRPPAVGPWTSREVEGWQRQWYVDGLDVSDPVTWDGWGIVPGHAAASLSIYSTGLTPEETEFRASGGHLPAGAEAIAPWLTWPERYEQIGDRTWDTSQVLPSYIHAGMGAWQATTTATAAMFNVDVRGIAMAWQEYVERGLEEMDRWMSTHKREDKSGEYWAGWAAKRGLYALPTFEERMSQPGRPSASFWHDWPERLRYDQIVRRRMIQLGRRQREALDTLLVAYCSKRQRAFDDPQLRDLLMERRKQLLDHPAVYRVNLEDVIDPDFRTAVNLARKTVEGGSLTAGPGHVGPTTQDGCSINERARGKCKPGSFPGPDAVPGAEPWGDPEAGSGGLGLALLAAGGVAAASIL